MLEVDRREQLMAAMEQAEDGTLEAPQETNIEHDDDPIRNEKGQFASRESEEAPEAQQAQEAEPTEEVEYTPSVSRPTTWKKEYLPLWDKLDRGENLAPNEAKALLQYQVQRENEFKKGVSAYKAEADNARSLTEAITPFVPELQKNGISPAAWINNLGRAHVILSQAPMPQKIEMFEKLAQDYGIDVNSYLNRGQNTTQYQDPQAQMLMQQIQMLNQEVQQVRGWKEQEEQGRLMGEIESFSSNVDKHPHFEMVREQMAQLLENGLAHDLETAYAKAVRLNDEVWSAEQERLLQSANQRASNQQRVAKAKATAVSPRSVTPNRQAATGDKKDRRAMLEEQLGSALNDRV